MSLARHPESCPSDARPRGFDFTGHMRQLCHDMVCRLPELCHIDMARVAVSFSQARRTTPHGLYATLTPLRFSGGRMHVIRRGRKWGVQRLHDPSGREMLYILSFYLPRFLDLDFRQKLTTLAHELWHIGPRFDGDVRRYQGRCYAHSSSRQHYDAYAEQLVDRWLAAGPPESAYRLLYEDYGQLVSHYGRVHGAKIPAPKLIPVG